MRISAETLPDCQVALEIEVDEQRVERSLEEAYRRLVRRTRIPGFRPGKTPRLVLERYLGREALMKEALDKLLPQVYEEAVREQNIEAIDLPALEVKQTEPVVVRATVPLKPRVELGDYRQVRLARELVVVPPERVQEVLEDLRHRYATWEPVERPVAEGDMVRAAVRASVDGTPVFEDEDAEFRVGEDLLLGLRDVLQELVGARKGEPREIVRPLPEDYPRSALAGRPCTFRFDVKEVKEEKLPELDDVFAREVGEGFPSLLALRERIAQNLQQEAQAEAEAGYREQVVEALLAQATVEFPPVVVEWEVERLLRDRQGNERLEEHLRRLGRSEAELWEELRPLAVQRVRRSLVLGKVAELEGMEVTPQEVEGEIQGMAAASSQEERVRLLLESDAGREAVRRGLLTRKTLARIAAIAGGEAPEEGSTGGEDS